MIPPYELPLHLAHVLAHYLKLDFRRQVGFGLSPITYSEIRAYCELNKIVLTGLELLAIEKLDRIKIEVAT